MQRGGMLVAGLVQLERLLAGFFDGAVATGEVPAPAGQGIAGERWFSYPDRVCHTACLTDGEAMFSK